jgi:hypothetical protein
VMTSLADSEKIVFDSLKERRLMEVEGMKPDDQFSEEDLRIHACVCAIAKAVSDGMPKPEGYIIEHAQELSAEIGTKINWRYK